MSAIVATLSLEASLTAARPLHGTGAIKGMAHITGGDITDNLPRVLPRGTDAIVREGSWDVLPIFRWLERAGGVPHEDMLRTFNMGVGLILVVSAGDADQVLASLAGEGRLIGAIASSSSPEPRVRYEGESHGLLP